MRKIAEYFDRYDLFFWSSLLLSVGFALWIFSKSDSQTVREIMVEHDRLLVLGRSDEAGQLLKDSLPKGNGPLDPIWLDLIRTRGSGYERFGLFIRILKGDPSRELTYEEIENLIQIAPEAFHREVKPLFLKDLNAISGVNKEWLEKYNLLLDQSQDD